jgi:hypothetical protein
VNRANQGGRANQGVGMPLKAAVVMACGCVAVLDVYL